MKDMLLYGIPETLGLTELRVPGCTLSVLLVKLFHESPLLRGLRHSLYVSVQLGQCRLRVLSGISLRR